MAHIQCERDCHSYLSPPQLQSLRLRTDVADERSTEDEFEIWDISNPEDPAKEVYSVLTPSAISRQAWLEDIQRALKDIGTFSFF